MTTDMKDEKWNKTLRQALDEFNKSEITVQQSSMQGWICPVCGRGLSPYTAVCPCKNGKGWEITC